MRIHVIRACHHALHAHAPQSLGALKSEHTLMASAYGVAAFLAHSWIASAAVGVGYTTVAVLSAKHQRSLADEAKSAILPIETLAEEELEQFNNILNRLGLEVVRQPEEE